MHLRASLMTTVGAAGLLLALAACGSSGPKRPSSVQDKSANTTLLERCSEYDARGIPPPADCPQATRRTQRERALPQLPDDPLGTPGLPTGTLPQRPLPIR